MAGMMSEQEIDVGVEIARIEEMINSGPMLRMRQSSRQSGLMVRPKNAASIILLRGKRGEEEVVMGKRNKALKFMPGALVFPGGRVDRADHYVKPADELDVCTRQKLVSNLRGRSNERRAQALAVAAVRELSEETGLIVGKQCDQTPRHADWQPFADKGVAPCISQLRLVARAITPPGVPRRFDTWFFAMRLEDNHHVPEEGFVSSGELEDLHWVAPQDAFRSDTREITRVILVELMNRLARDPDLDSAYPAPCYTTRYDRFHRHMM